MGELGRGTSTFMSQVRGKDEEESDSEGVCLLYSDRARASARVCVVLARQLSVVDDRYDRCVLFYSVLLHLIFLIHACRPRLCYLLRVVLLPFIPFPPPPVTSGSSSDAGNIFQLVRPGVTSRSGIDLNTFAVHITRAYRMAWMAGHTLLLLISFGCAVYANLFAEKPTVGVPSPSFVSFRV